MTRKEMKQRVARKLLYGDLDEIHVITFDLDTVLNEGKVVFYSHVVNVDPTKNYVNGTKTETVDLNDDNWKIWFSNEANKSSLSILAANISIEKVEENAYIMKFSSQYIDDTKKYHIVNENYVEDVKIKPNQSVIAIYPNTISAPIIVIDDNKELNVPDLDNCIKYMYAENYEFNSLNYTINVYDKDEEHLGIKTITAEQKSHIMMTVTSAQRETKKYDESGRLTKYSNPVTRITCKRKGNVLYTYYKGDLLYEFDEEKQEFTEHVKEIVKDSNSGMYVKHYLNSDLINVYNNPEKVDEADVISSTYMDGNDIIIKIKSTTIKEGNRIVYEDCSGIKYETVLDHNGEVIMYRDLDFDIITCNGKILKFNSPFMFTDTDNLYIRNIGVPCELIYKPEQ